MPKPPDSEKLTLNLGFVDLGSIDLLVRDGFYSNRSDFIRTAIRNQLARHADTAKEAASRLTLELGLRTFARRDLEAVQASGKPLKIRVLGLAVIADDVTPDLARATIEFDHRARRPARACRRQSSARRPRALRNTNGNKLMKHRVLDVMSEALDLVRKSDLAKATAVIREALSGGEAGTNTGVPQSRPPGRAGPHPGRRSLGETLRALRAKPSFLPPARAAPPRRSLRASPARDFCCAPTSTPQVRSAIASMFRRTTSGGSSRWCSCFTAAPRIRKISRSVPR